jgi:ABC-type thiamine transport system ATPase subunit
MRAAVSLAAIAGSIRLSARNTFFATKAGLVKLLKEVRSASGATVLHVTHHPEEAEALADVRLTLADGRVTAEAAGQ